MISAAGPGFIEKSYTPWRSFLRFPLTGQRGNMKAYWIIGIAMAAGLRASAQDCVVTVYVRTDALAPTGMVFLAEAKTTAIFRAIGVPMRWRAGAPPSKPLDKACGAPLVIRIEYSDGVHVSSEALAYAMPFVDSGTCIHILLDRVLRSSTASLAPEVLAYVLAHEITHVLERIDRHSEEGIMKAHWGSSDFQRMACSGFAFAADDIEMIHSGIAQRTLHAAAERNVY